MSDAAERLKKFRGNGGSTRKKWQAATFSVLKVLRQRLNQKRWKDDSSSAVWAFCCAAYFGSFRAGELLAKSDWAFDKYSDLVWGDLT